MIITATVISFTLCTFPNEVKQTSSLHKSYPSIRDLYFRSVRFMINKMLVKILKYLTFKHICCFTIPALSNENKSKYFVPTDYYIVVSSCTSLGNVISHLVRVYIYSTVSACACVWVISTLNLLFR